MARDSEQLIIIREQIGDGSGREMDPCSGSDAEQMEPWPGGGQRLGDGSCEMDPCSGQRLRADDNHPGDRSTQRIRYRAAGTVARDSEQLIIIREQIRDGSGREMDPCSGSDAEQMEPWPGGGQRLGAADNYPGTDRRRRQPGDRSTQGIRCRAAGTMARDSETAAVRWIHAAARDSEQLIIIRKQTGDSCSWETDPHSGSDTGQMEPWLDGSQRLRADDNHPGTDRRRQRPGDRSTRRI